MMFGILTLITSTINSTISISTRTPVQVQETAWKQAVRGSPVYHIKVVRTPYAQQDNASYSEVRTIAQDKA